MIVWINRLKKKLELARKKRAEEEEKVQWAIYKYNTDDTGTQSHTNAEM